MVPSYQAESISSVGEKGEFVLFRKRIRCYFRRLLKGIEVLVFDQKLGKNIVVFFLQLNSRQDGVHLLEPPHLFGDRNYYAYAKS
jgi:hypothetical protein